jgi:hypothetical protein
MFGGRHQPLVREHQRSGKISSNDEASAGIFALPGALNLGIDLLVVSERAPSPRTMEAGYPPS